MKFSFAMTEAQEIGWDMDTHHRIHTPQGLATKHIKCSNEVNYAADYIRFQKVNPFSAKRFDPTAKKKE